MSASMQPISVLVTGGLGYLGSHTAVALAEAGFRVVIVDNLSNSSIEVLERIESACTASPATYCGDVRDLALLQTVLRRNPVQCAVHLAGLGAVAESARVPVDYYDVNVNGTMTLLRALEEVGVRRMVFSSSAAVYGDRGPDPLHEDAGTAPISAFGRSKRAAEDLLADACGADARWGVATLRCFNPAGAHPGGNIGERRPGVPHHLLPYVAQVAEGERPALRVFGNDYPTADGTGVRDYVHVVDVADAHVRAVQRLLSERGGHVVANIGSGNGHSVLDVVRAYERVPGRRVPCEVAPRRPGDIASCRADTRRAESLLGWRARYTLDDICRDIARFEALQRQRHQAPALPRQMRERRTAEALPLA
jgi:UDP-glucose 4-epimerase